MSTVQEEVEWFKKHVSEGLADPLRRISDVADRLERSEAQMSGISAQILLIRRLGSAVAQLSEVCDAWESHNEKLVQSATEVQAESARMKETHDTLRNQLQAADATISSQSAKISALEECLRQLDPKDISDESDPSHAAGTAEILNAIKDLKRRTYLEREETNTERRERVLAQQESQAYAERMEKRMEALEASVRGFVRSEDDVIQQVSRTSVDRGVKRRRLHQSTHETTHPTSSEDSTASASASSTAGAVDSSTAVSGTDPSLPRPVFDLTSLIDFGGDEDLQNEFGQSFAGWTAEKMVVEFDGICIKRPRTSPEKTCLTSKCLGGGKHQFRAGPMNASLRSNCPTHAMGAGTCMKLSAAVNTMDVPYTPGQQRYSVTRRT